MTPTPLQIQNALRVITHAAGQQNLRYYGNDLWEVNGETMRSQEAGPLLAASTSNAREAPTLPQSTLSPRERLLLEKLKNGMLTLNPGAESKIEILLKKGYCQTCGVRSGPTGVNTGETGLVLTEAGRIALAFI